MRLQRPAGGGLSTGGRILPQNPIGQRSQSIGSQPPPPAGKVMHLYLWPSQVSLMRLYMSANALLLQKAVDSLSC